MGITERRNRERAGVRSRILEASREIAFSEGASALTMRRIADRIEYSAAAIYQHFASREAIVRELCREGFGQLLAAVAPAATAPDAADRVAEIARAYVAFGLAHPELYRLLFMEDAALTSALYGPIESEDDPGRVAIAALIRALEELAAARRIDPAADAAHLAETFWAMIHGIVSLKIACPYFPVTPAAELAESAIRVFLAGTASTATVF